jgi:catechol 2,3-dioxygenase
MGPVHLTVADLDRSLDYYRGEIGLEALERSDGKAVLGTAERPLLVLSESPGARPADGYTGLFHFALLVPERADLARGLAHAARDRVQLTGASDHYVSEALYLRDPDHHGIEIYWDRPRETWEGQVDQRLVTWPLDVQAILGVLEDPIAAPFEGLPAGTRMGHVHLRVRDVPEAISFYRDLLGFDLMAQLGDQAGFLAAGGYHHHLGANTWESRGAPPPPPDTAAFQHATIQLPSPQDVSAVADRVADAGREVTEQEGAPVVTDPSGNRMALVSE